MFGFMLLSILFWVAIIGGGFYLGFRFVRAFELRGADRQQVLELRDQLLRLEEQVDSMTQDVERLTEEQRFTTRLLSERHEAPDP